MGENQGRFNILMQGIDAWRCVKRVTVGWLPSKGSALFTLLVAGGLLWTGTVGADPLGRLLAGSPPPRMVNYQGRLLDSGGNTVGDGTYPLRFALFCEAEQGTPFWCEPANCTDNAQIPVAGGLFNVTLGQANPFPTSFPCPSSPYLQVTVDGEAMLPRERLTSVPFALRTELEDGAVTTEKIADDAVTTAKLSASAVTQSKGAQGVMDVTTTSNTWTDIPARTVTLTTTGGAVLAMFSGSHKLTRKNNDGNDVGYWRIMRDDATVVAYGSQYFSMTNWDSINLVGLDMPPAGPHTYTLQWRVTDGSQLKASENEYTENLVVIELRR